MSRPIVFTPVGKPSKVSKVKVIENPYELDVQSEAFKALELAYKNNKHIPAPTQGTREERIAALRAKLK